MLFRICASDKRWNISTPHPGPLLVRRGEGQLFCGTVTQGSPEGFRGNRWANCCCPVGASQFSFARGSGAAAPPYRRNPVNPVNSVSPLRLRDYSVQFWQNNSPSPRGGRPGCSFVPSFHPLTCSFVPMCRLVSDAHWQYQ
jgi:hypothetical protein